MDINSYCKWQARSKIDIITLVFLQLAMAKHVVSVRGKMRKDRYTSITDHDSPVTCPINIDRLLVRVLPIGHFGKYHNTLCLSPQTLQKHCFQFLLGITMVQRENKNKAYAKFGGTNKEYCIFRNGQWWLSRVCRKFTHAHTFCGIKTINNDHKSNETSVSQRM